MRRVCFRLKVRPERIAKYRERHAAVWPEMLAALREAGWHHYSLFLHPDGTLIGYFLTEDLDESLAAMDRTEVNRRWQAEMAPIFAGLGDDRPDEAFEVLDEIFHLETQLARLPETREGPT